MLSYYDQFLVDYYLSKYYYTFHFTFKLLTVIKFTSLLLYLHILTHMSIIHFTSFINLCFYFQDFKMFVDEDENVYWVVYWSYVYSGYVLRWILSICSKGRVVEDSCVKRNNFSCNCLFCIVTGLPKAAKSVARSTWTMIPYLGILV